MDIYLHASTINKTTKFLSWAFTFVNIFLDKVYWKLPTFKFKC